MSQFCVIICSSIFFLLFYILFSIFWSNEKANVTQNFVHTIIRVDIEAFRRSITFVPPSPIDLPHMGQPSPIFHVGMQA
jgi:hypothetical protein